MVKGTEASSNSSFREERSGQIGHANNTLFDQYSQSVVVVP